MKRRLFFSLLAAGVIVLLLIGIGGYYWLVQASPLTVGKKTPAAAIFVPKQSPAMVSLLVNPDRLTGIQAVVRPNEWQQTHAELNQLKTSLLANTGLDYQQDIQPWLGNEITLAVTTTDIDHKAENGRQPGYLMVLATKDVQKSREFLQLMFSQRATAGTELVNQQYKGVKLINAGTLAGAVVGEHVLFANDLKVLRSALNNVQAADLNLLSSTQYQQALSLLTPRSIGVTFLNLPSVSAWLGYKPTTHTYQSQLITWELNRQGLLAETVLLAAPTQETSPPAPELTQPVGALKYMPAPASFSISGSDLSRLGNTDLNQLWTQTSAISSSGYDAISRLNQPLADLQTYWGIDLPNDIFSWVQGEYALGLLPDAEQTNPDLIFVAEKSANAATGIARLDQIATQKGLSITPLTLKEQKIFAWTQLTTAPANSSSPESSITLQAKVKGAHTTVGDYEIFTTSIEAMDQAINRTMGSLADHPQFQASVEAMPQPNQGYVYLDWVASRKLLERQLPILKLLEVVGKPFFSHLRSLTVSSYGSETGILKGGILFCLTSSPT